MTFEEQVAQEDIEERIEHQNALVDINMILETQTGRRFMKYLFKNFDVGLLPDFGTEGMLMHERLGMLRAGRALFEIVSEANSEKAGVILAELERERHAKLILRKMADEATDE